MDRICTNLSAISPPLNGSIAGRRSEGRSGNPLRQSEFSIGVGFALQ